jgi:hypothetical protein
MEYKLPNKILAGTLILCGFSTATAVELSPFEDFEKLALSIRNREIYKIPGEMFLKEPTRPNIAKATAYYPWRKNILTTVFWVGEKPGQNNPVPNDKSSWDGNWMKNYGGYDCPSNRIGYRPIGFMPKQNPFYIALPYNDIDQHGTKSEANKVIPWFQRQFRKNGESVCKSRWIAIHYKGRICYAQWEDVGPKKTDNWQYVFGNAVPKEPGLDVSPAVKDYLGADPKDFTDWKFVELEEIPNGPWTKYGENNPFSPYFKPTLPKTQFTYNTPKSTF